MEDFHDPQAPPMIGLLMKIAEEFKAPVSLAVMLALIGAVGWLAQNKASRDEVGTLQLQVTNMQVALTGLQFTIEYDHADSRLQATQEQIFTLTQKIKANAKAGKEEDASDLQRLDELQNLQKRYSSQIEALERRREK